MKKVGERKKKKKRKRKRKEVDRRKLRAPS
jgi:hypothetical protein